VKKGTEHFWEDERGTVLLVVLVMVVVLGLTAAVTGSSWKTLVQQSREEELFWRGDQIRKAIESYYSPVNGALQQFPAKLEDLVKDPRSLQTVRHLRRLYPDPMTGDDWVLIKDPGGRITGVRSASALEPFRKDGFPEGYDAFVGRSKYSEWEFVYVPTVQRSSRPTNSAARGAAPATGVPSPATAN